MDTLDRLIINHLQNGLPICEAPYQEIALQLGTTEDELLARLQRLLETGILSRFGPLFNIEKIGGAFTLAAVKAPMERFDEISAIINAFPEVAHNYAREHVLNMWFVLATETHAHISEVIQQIEQQTGLTVYNMPKQQEYFVGLRLEA